MRGTVVRTLKGTLSGPLRGPVGSLKGPLGVPLGESLGDPWGTPGGPSEDHGVTLGGHLEDPWRTLEEPLRDPFLGGSSWGGPWDGPSWDPGGTLGGLLMHPWGTLGGFFEDPRRTLREPLVERRGPLGKTAETPRSTDIRAAKVCIHVPWPKTKVCVNVETEVPARKSEVCLQVQFTKVCKHIPRPKGKVCAHEPSPPRCVYTHLGFNTEVCVKVQVAMQQPALECETIQYEAQNQGLVDPICSSHSKMQFRALKGVPWGALGEPLGDPWRTRGGPLGNP